MFSFYVIKFFSFQLNLTANVLFTYLRIYFSTCPSPGVWGLLSPPNLGFYFFTNKNHWSQLLQVVLKAPREGRSWVANGASLVLVDCSEHNHAHLYSFISDPLHCADAVQWSEHLNVSLDCRCPEQEQHLSCLFSPQCPTEYIYTRHSKWWLPNGRLDYFKNPTLENLRQNEHPSIHSFNKYLVNTHCVQAPAEV